MRRFVILLAVLLTSGGRAEIKLAPLFSDHAVLQQQLEVPIWGTAAPGESVTVSLADKTVTVAANAAGEWLAKLNQLPAGGPHTLTVKGTNTLTVKDVLVGEVWLGSGQSNMAMTVNRCANAEKEAAEAQYPQLRMFTVKSGPNLKPQTAVTGQWIVCSPMTVNAFSGTGYFFGRELHTTLKVPVGIINSSVGGTPIEAWTSLPAQSAVPELARLVELAEKADADYNPERAKANYEKQLAQWKEAVAAAKAAGKPEPTKPREPTQPKTGTGFPSVLFNGKIHPLKPYRLRGVIWYQGEANTDAARAKLYEQQLTTLITDWRTHWQQPDLPFGWVQLPNYAAGQRDWPTVRAGMAKCLKLPNTGMAVTIDIGEASDIHPRNKQDVGLRLAKWALATVYGQKIAYRGPEVENLGTAGAQLVVTFNQAEGGLVVKGERLTGFEIAGGDEQWHPAEATVEGRTVRLSSPKVPMPAKVRYGWANQPTCNLYNAAGLPAGPFLR
jgi:sialate O-acetylesterase